MPGCNALAVYAAKRESDNERYVALDGKKALPRDRVRCFDTPPHRETPGKVELQKNTY